LKEFLSGVLEAIKLGARPGSIRPEHVRGAQSASSEGRRSHLEKQGASGVGAEPASTSSRSTVSSCGGSAAENRAFPAA